MSRVTTTTHPTFGRFAVRGALYLLALLVPPLLVGIFVLIQAGAALVAPPTQRFDEPLPHRPIHDPDKPTVAVIASNEGTEISDFLAPYEVFATSGAFNVYAVAPKRQFTPFMWGGVDIMPHYSFAELDELLGGNPDVIVIPFTRNAENTEIVQWIRERAGEHTLVVSICGGAHTLAATGLVDNGKVTTHHTYFRLLEKEYPHIELVRDVRYTDNGNTITSAGITAGIDASLYAIQKLLGKEAALATAAKMQYPHTQFLDAPAYQLPSLSGPGDVANLNAAFYWQKATYGVYLYDGVGEIDLTALLDSYGRTFTARTTTLAAERQIIHSRHGLNLIPREDFSSARRFDRIIVPGGETAPTQELAEWTQRTQQPQAELQYSPEILRQIAIPFGYDATLTDLAMRSSKADALGSAKTLEYPTEHLSLADKPWPMQRLLTGFVLALAGVATMRLIERRWMRRRHAQEQEVKLPELAPHTV